MGTCIIYIVLSCLILWMIHCALIMRPVIVVVKPKQASGPLHGDIAQSVRNNDLAADMVRQDYLDDNEWLDVALTIVSSLTLSSSLPICMVL